MMSAFPAPLAFF